MKLLLLAALLGGCCAPAAGYQVEYARPYHHHHYRLHASELCPDCGAIPGVYEGPPPADTLLEPDDPPVGDMIPPTAHSATFASQPGARPLVPSAPAVPQATDAEDP